MAPIATPTIHGMGELERTIESAVHFDHVHPDYDENTPASYQQTVDTDPGDPDTIVELVCIGSSRV